MQPWVARQRARDKTGCDGKRSPTLLGRVAIRRANNSNATLGGACCCSADKRKRREWLPGKALSPMRDSPESTTAAFPRAFHSRLPRRAAGLSQFPCLTAKCFQTACQHPFCPPQADCRIE